MGDPFEKRAEEWLNSVINQVACGWCRFRDRTLYRDGLCGSCYDIRAKLRRLHRLATAADVKYGKAWPLRGSLIALEIEYIEAIEMADAAQILGKMYEDYLTNVEPLECENEFRMLAKRFLKKELFNGHAFLFENLSPVNRRYVIYLIGIIMQYHISRNRRKIASRTTINKTKEEALASRGWGAYRVENDTYMKKSIEPKPSRKR